MNSKYYVLSQLGIFPIWLTRSSNQCQSYESEFKWFFEQLHQVLSFSFVYWLCYELFLFCLKQADWLENSRKKNQNSWLQNWLLDLVIIIKLLFSDGVIKQGLMPNVVFILACTKFGWKHSQLFAISFCRQYLWQLWN